MAIFHKSILDNNTHQTESRMLVSLVQRQDQCTVNMCDTRRIAHAYKNPIFQLHRMTKNNAYNLWINVHTLPHAAVGAVPLVDADVLDMFIQFVWSWQQQYTGLPRITGLSLHNPCKQIIVRMSRTEPIRNAHTACQ